MYEKALDFLLSAQNQDEGWGYAPGHASTVEATAAATLALHTEPIGAEALGRALDWLRSAQNRDGGWGLVAGDPTSGWQTAWALLSLRADGQATQSLARGVSWLLAVEMPQPSADEMQRIEQVLGIDPTVRGWPWLPGQATWVEPTALAMVALDTAPPSEATQARLDEGTRFLTDRRCTGGGWNVGNPVMFSQPLPPRPHPTAWVLLALHRVAPAAVEPADVAALRREMLLDGGTSALAWGLLALHDLGQEDAAAREQLQALQRGDGSWDGNPYHTALALLTLGRGWPA